MDSYTSLIDGQNYIQVDENCGDRSINHCNGGMKDGEWKITFNILSGRHLRCGAPGGGICKQEMEHPPEL